MRLIRRRLLCACIGVTCLFTVALAVAIAAAAAPDGSSEWPTWRGANRDGLSADTGLLAEWSADGPPLAWRADGLGRGYSSVAIAEGRLFTLGKRRGDAELIALELDSGRELWAAPVGDGNPNSTPTVDGGLVFALGRSGDLVCAETATGRVVWKKNFRQDFDGRMMSGWGYSESPLVDGEKLLVTPGGREAVIVALNKRTGDLIWQAALPEGLAKQEGRRRSASNDGAGYSSIVVSEAAGVRQYVQLIGHGVVAVAADDGRFLWDYPRIANRTANIPTPIVSGDYVFTSSGYGDGGSALLEVVRDGGQLAVEEVWYHPARELQNHHGGVLLVGDHLYFGHAHNNGFPVCVELKTGDVAWGGRIRGADGNGTGSAAVVYADGHVYFRYENGVMALVEATPEAYRLKGWFKLATNHDRSWPHPVVAGGRLYLRDQQTLLCYDVRSQGAR